MPLTGEDVAEFVCVILVPVEEVCETHDHQAQDGGEDAEPLTGCQAAPQERHREQPSEDDDRSTQHLEAGGTGHVESCNKEIRVTRCSFSFLSVTHV